MVSYRGCSSFHNLLILALALSVYAAGSKDSVGCVTKVEQFEVRGNSLAPLIKPGQSIKLLYGYYNCHPVEKEDIVAYKYAGNDAPIIKIIKAIPGDKWRLNKNHRRNIYQIMVDGKPLKNSQGKYYGIPESKIRMLKLYVQDYPVLPENTYLILGNQISGSLDATRFGLIDKSDILGKVEQ